MPPSPSARSAEPVEAQAIGALWWEDKGEGGEGKYRKFGQSRIGGDMGRSTRKSPRLCEKGRNSWLGWLPEESGARSWPAKVLHLGRWPNICYNLRDLLLYSNYSKTKWEMSVKDNI